MPSLDRRWRSMAWTRETLFCMAWMSTPLAFDSFSGRAFPGRSVERYIEYLPEFKASKQHELVVFKERL